MSTIDYDALLKNELFDENSLIEALSAFFTCDIRVARRFDRTVHMELYSGERLECEAYLVNRTTGATWDSSITNEEYSYRQCISIALDKEAADMDAVANVMNFFLKLAKEKDAEMLVKSYVHDDICYIRDGKIMWNDSFYREYKDLLASS